MRVHFASLCLLVAFGGLSLMAQPVSKSSISGRITIKGNPAPGVVVSLEGPPGESPSEARLGLITKTDETGNYRFDDVPKGDHLVAPRAYDYVLPLENNSLKPGRNLTITPGDNVEGVNFDLVKGAVITGKISESSGRPAVGQRVQVWKAGTGPRLTPYMNLGFQMFQTDDRGIYRIYGMPAGKYLVSVGVDTSTSNLTIGSSGRFSPIRYYPGMEERTQAKILELAEGQEVADIDITMAKPEKTYKAKLRVVDAETREPVVGAMVGYGNIAPGQGNRMGAAGFTGEKTNENGEMFLFGLRTGKYGVFIRPDEVSGYYAEENSFDVRDSDVDTVEISAKKGAAISGKVEIQDDAGSSSILRGARVSVSSPSPVVPILNDSQIGADGSFKITGIGAGKAMLNVTPPKGYRVIRYERDGARITRDLVLNAGEKVTGVRILLGKGIGTIKGQVTVDGGQPPEGLRFYIVGNRVDELSDYIMGPNGNIMVDSLGRFTIEGLLTGDYEVQVLPMASPGGPSTKGISPRKMLVSVGVEPVSVVFTIDLSKQGGK